MLLAAPTGRQAAAAEAGKPNIIFILADDLGFGDVKCDFPAGKIATPNIDRLASEGMRFVDAHAPSSLCSPTRYSTLTGRYCWRTRLTKGVLWQWEKPLIPANRLTLPELLRSRGYHTAALGKWHLGLEWPFASPASAAKLDVIANQDDARPEDIDWSKPITGGPVDRGFDYYFGVNCPNFSPYIYIENDHVVGAPPSEIWPHIGGRLSQHSGPRRRASTAGGRPRSWRRKRCG